MDSSPDRHERVAFTRARRFLEKPVGVAAVSGGLAVVVVALLAAASPVGLSGFVHAAPPHTDRARAPASLDVLPHDRGFDGQFYYRMAVDPFSGAKRVAGVEFDLPALRNQRVGYPLLVRVLTLGNRDAVPFVLIALNVLAMFALGWLGGALAQTMGRAATWGLLFPLFPGFVYSLAFDLSEIVAATFLIAAVLALQRRRPAVAAVAATAAVLTRETTLILPIALVAAALWPESRGSDQRNDRRAMFLVAIPPIAVFTAWHLWLRWRWGAFPLASSGDKNIRLPFVGLVDSLDKFFPPVSGAALFRDLSLALLLIVVVAAALALSRSDARRYQKIAFVMAAAVMTLLSGFIWEGATSFMRAGTEIYCFALLVVLSDHLTNARLAANRLIAASTVTVYGLTIASEIAKAR